MDFFGITYNFLSYFMYGMYYIFLFFAGVCGMYISYGLYESRFTEAGRKKIAYMDEQMKHQQEIQSMQRQMIQKMNEKDKGE